MSAGSILNAAARHLVRYFSLPPEYARVLVYYIAVSICSIPVYFVIGYLARFLIIEVVYYLGATLCFVLMVIEAWIDFPQGRRLPYNILGSLIFSLGLSGLLVGYLGASG